jgi:hypothetical protein
MRRLVAALVMATLALVLVACSTETPVATLGSAAKSGATTPKSVSTTASPEGTDTLSPVQRADNSPLPSRSDETPDVVLTDLKNRMPMMLYFYDASQAITTRQNKENEAAVAKYRGTLDYLSFNINAGLPGSGSNGDIQTNRAALMAANLQVSFTPYLVLVDSYGRVVFKSNGFMDRKLIEREILRATGQ